MGEGIVIGLGLVFFVVLIAYFVGSYLDSKKSDNVFW